MNNEDSGSISLLDDEETEKQPLKRSIVAKPSFKQEIQADLLLVNPCIKGLFNKYNKMFFNDFIKNVVVQWSSRMTLCAGLCRVKRFYPISMEIRLSSKILQFRPTKDLIETLIHEMIHAYLFTKQRNKHHHDGHGADFIKVMTYINFVTGLNISAYHDFVDEVNLLRKYVWRCNGVCKFKSPFYGWVKRSINRKPGKSDWWYARHMKECGGEFVPFNIENKSKGRTKNVTN